MASKPTALVVGGAGFLGKHIVQQLIDAGTYNVRVFDIRDCNVPGSHTVVGDIRQLEDVVAAVSGVDVVIHVATATPTSENALNRQLMDDVNVKGTQHVIEACRRSGVTKLVYTSSASVVFHGQHLQGVDESLPYTGRPMDYYTATKIRGEQLVLAANDASLATCALRPSGIFGEGDTVMVPTLVRQAKAGKMKFIIGSGGNCWDFTYVGNVAQAHLLAADRLAPGTPIAGQAFFITNQQPVPMWGLFGDLLSGLGYRRPSIKLPFTLILLVAMLFEYAIRPLVAPFKQLSTDFTVFRVRTVACERRFSSDKATKLLGYVPGVSMEDGVARTIKAFQHLRAEEGVATNGAAEKKAH